MIKAIIFDSHDTVIKNGLYSVLNKSQIQALKPEIWQPFWRGKISEEEFWQKVAIDFAKDDTWIKKSRTAYYTKSIPIKGVLPLVKKLKKKYKLAILANCPKPWFDDAVLRFKLDQIFDVLISSGETGLLKPNKEIYLLTCQKLKVSPRDCLYIDDDEMKLQAAKNLGMKGILFKNLRQLVKTLKNEGVFE